MPSLFVLVNFYCFSLFAEFEFVAFFVSLLCFALIIHFIDASLFLSSVAALTANKRAQQQRKYGINIRYSPRHVQVGGGRGGEGELIHR